ISPILDLIEAIEGKNGPTYCYSHSTLLSLEHPISPISRQPLPDHVLIKAMLVEWGLRGLFNVGPLVGLYPDFPKKIIIEPRAGSILINKEIVEPIRKTVTGNIYDISVGFSDGSLTDL